MYKKDLFIDSENLPESLSKEETYQLFQNVHNGSRKDWEKLVIHNIRLVLYEVLTKFKNVNYDERELTSIGIVGLIKAVNTYDISKDIEFSTYATKCIENEIRMSLRKNKTYQKRFVDSLDRVLFENSASSYKTVGEHFIYYDDFVEEFETKEIYRIIREMVDELPDRDREIIKLYYGFYKGRLFLQSEIATKLNISQASVSRDIIRITKKLGRQLERKGVIETHKMVEESQEKNIKVKRKK